MSDTFFWGDFIPVLGIEAAYFNSRLEDGHLIEPIWFYHRTLDPSIDPTVYSGQAVPLKMSFIGQIDFLNQFGFDKTV